MKRSKIGLEKRVLGALIFLMAALGGYPSMLLLAGYIFLVEKDYDLCGDVLQSFFITISYSIIKMFVEYIPMIISWFVVLFSLEVDAIDISYYCRTISQIIEFVRIIVLLKTAFDAYRNR